MPHNKERSETIIRESLNDITDEEFDNILLPYFNNFNDYIIKYVLPEVVAFAYERDAMDDVINVIDSL